MSDETPAEYGKRIADKYGRDLTTDPAVPENDRNTPAGEIKACAHCDAPGSDVCEGRLIELLRDDLDRARHIAESYLSCAQTAEAEVAALKAELEESERRGRELIEDFDAVKAELENRDQRFIEQCGADARAAVADEVAALREQKDSACRAYEHVSSQLTPLRKEVAALKEELRSTRAERDYFKRVFNQQTEDGERWEVEIAALRAELAEAKNLATRYATAAWELRAEVERMSPVVENAVAWMEGSLTDAEFAKFIQEEVDGDAYREGNRGERSDD